MDGWFGYPIESEEYDKHETDNSTEGDRSHDPSEATNKKSDLDCTFSQSSPYNDFKDR